MREQLLRLVRKELNAFYRRGGDDLEAGWVEENADLGISRLELRCRATGLKHEVHLVEMEGKCDLKIDDYGVSEVLGIICAAREGVILDSSYDFQAGEAEPRPDELRKFARRLARVLDENQGRFEPQREYGVALSRNARAYLRRIKEGLPDDGSITVICNNDPAREQKVDDILFTARGDMLDFYVLLGNDNVTVYGSGGEIATMPHNKAIYELEHLVRERVSAYQNALTP